MAITYPLTFPNIPIHTSSFSITVNQISFLSETSGAGTHIARDGKTDRWEGFFTTPHLSRAQHDEMVGWVLSLNGRVGTFNVFDPDRKEPSTKAGSFPGNGLMNGAGQTGTSLVSDGWPTSSLILKAGDLFQVETQLYEVTSDATTDASGNVTINFEPEIRVSPANNAAITTTTPIMLARLKAPDFIWNTDVTKLGPLTIQFEEVI